MTIDTRDHLIRALGNASTQAVWDKASLANAVAGQWFSFWTAAGLPGTGVAPAAAVVPTNATLGAPSFPNQVAPVTSYLGHGVLTSGLNLAAVEFHDRLAHMGGLSGTVTTAQGALDLTVTNPGAERLGRANFADVQWWLEVYAPLGATGVNATVAVTYDDASTGTLPVIALGATPRQGRMYPINPVNGRFIRAVNSVTLSATTGTAGNFGITATGYKTAINSALANMAVERDWAQLGLAKVPNSACLFPVQFCSGTATGTLRSTLRLVHG